MKKVQCYIITILYTFILFSCAADSQEGENDNSVKVTELKETSKEAGIGLEKDSIELTKEQKEAFEQRAIQKFHDFIDYLKIISDPKVAPDMKEHSIDLALGLFANDSTFFSDSTVTNINNKMLLKEYIAKMKSRKKAISISIETIQFIEPLKLDTANSYIGTIQVLLKIKTKILQKKVAVHLVKIEKNFGEDNQHISEVRLGNIY